MNYSTIPGIPYCHPVSNSRLTGNSHKTHIPYSPNTWYLKLLSWIAWHCRIPDFFFNISASLLSFHLITNELHRYWLRQENCGKPTKWMFSHLHEVVNQVCHTGNLTFEWGSAEWHLRIWGSDADSENPNMWGIVERDRITALTLEIGEVSHGQMWLFFRGNNYRGTVGMVIVILAYLCE